MNEANDLLNEYNEQLRRKLLLMKEEFDDDILPAIRKEKDFEIEFDVDEKAKDILIIKWRWKSRQLKRIKTFCRQAQAEPEEFFICKVKSYLFELIVMLLNL